MIRVLAVVTCLVAGAALAADNPPPPAAARKAKTVNDPDELVCKSQPNPGSRLGGRKVCVSRRDWEQQTQITKEFFRSLPPAGMNGSNMTSGMGMGK